MEKSIKGRKKTDKVSIPQLKSSFDKLRIITWQDNTLESEILVLLVSLDLGVLAPGLLLDL